jgi:hypothetical protein
MTERPLRHNVLTAQLTAILWSLVIFGLSSVPSDKIPVFALSVSDKLIHGVIFSVFCFLWYRAFRYQTRFPWLARYPLTSSILLTIMYGISDEIHQLFVPGRSSEVFDVVADTAGGILCAIVLIAWPRFHHAKRAAQSSGKPQ